MEKKPVKFAEILAPFCPVCGSGEYMNNEDGNRNDFCGQCGTALDWNNMENVETDEIVKMDKYAYCRYCKYYTALPKGIRGGEKGNCTVHTYSNPHYGSARACKKFVCRITELG